jgi:hypothetical protein
VRPCLRERERERERERGTEERETERRKPGLLIIQCQKEIYTEITILPWV